MKTDYSDNLQFGIQHNDGRSEELLESALQNIRNGTGSFTGSLSTLSRISCSRALLAFFRDGHPELFRQWAYSAARFDAELMSRGWYDDYLIGDLVWAVLSDNNEIIEWYAASAPRFSTEAFVSDIGKPKSMAFYRYQAYLALQSRWDELGERAEQVLAISGQIKRDTEYLIDQEFYLALARGDADSMESIIGKLVTPQLRKKRYKTQNGLARDMMDTYAILFSKIAVRSGYDIRVDSPWIPRELLNLKPCSEYPDFFGAFLPLK